jgi:DNA mismatch repair ATPase MutS
MTSGGGASSDATADEIAAAKYLALSAAGALLHFIGSQQIGMRVVPGSIGIKDLQLTSYMQLDRQTTAALEIVRSQRPPPGTQEQSFFNNQVYQ